MATKRLHVAVPPATGRHKHELTRWLDAKRSGIGGSSAAAAVGLGKFGSRLRLWAEMTTQAGFETREESYRADQLERLRWGNLDEGGLLSEAVRRVRGQVVRGSKAGASLCPGADLIDIFAMKPGGQALLRSKASGWMHYSPDGFAVRRDRGGDVCLLEAKTTSVWNAKDWESDIPEAYYLQVQHGLFVTGLDLCLVAVKIGGQEARLFDVTRDDDVIKALVSGEAAFMRHVQTRTPPPPETPGHPDTIDVLKRLYPDDNGETVELPPEAITLGNRLEELKELKKEAEDELKSIEATFRAWIGNATFGEVPGGDAIYTLKTTKNKGYTSVVKPYTYRSLVRKSIR